MGKENIPSNDITERTSEDVQLLFDSKIKPILDEIAVDLKYLRGDEYSLDSSLKKEHIKTLRISTFRTGKLSKQFRKASESVKSAAKNLKETAIINDFEFSFIKELGLPLFHTRSECHRLLAQMYQINQKQELRLYFELLAGYDYLSIAQQDSNLTPQEHFILRNRNANSFYNAFKLQNSKIFSLEKPEEFEKKCTIMYLCAFYQYAVLPEEKQDVFAKDIEQTQENFIKLLDKNRQNLEKMLSNWNIRLDINSFGVEIDGNLEKIRELMTTPYYTLPI